VHLGAIGRIGNKIGHDWDLEGAGRSNHILRLDHAF
jgi:hypothetical protein